MITRQQSELPGVCCTEPDLIATFRLSPFRLSTGERTDVFSSAREETHRKEWL